MATHDILVTGGAGYIGAVVAKVLTLKGYSVHIVDDMSRGHSVLARLTGAKSVHIGDIRDLEFLRQVFKSTNCSAVMHFAALTYVHESVEKPKTYYSVNTIGTFHLLEAMLEANVTKMVFSSSAAVYGSPQDIPIKESAPCNPINPYGLSKLYCEQLLNYFDTMFDIKYVSLRYFNAAGALNEAKIGEAHDPETHLIPRVIMALLNDDEIDVYGENYNTPDGTCIRDYVHVKDIAEAHILSLNYLLEGKESNTFNIGSQSGFSVREIISTAEKIIGKKARIVIKPRRAGDPPVLIADSQKIQETLDWQPINSSLSSIISSAYSWHKDIMPTIFS